MPFPQPVCLALFGNPIWAHLVAACLPGRTRGLASSAKIHNVSSQLESSAILSTGRAVAEPSNELPTAKRLRGGIWPSSCRARNRMKNWEAIADNLNKAGWSWGCVSAIDSNRRTIWIVGAHRGDGKRFGDTSGNQLCALSSFARARFGSSIRQATSSALFPSTRRTENCERASHRARCKSLSL